MGIRDGSWSKLYPAGKTNLTSKVRLVTVLELSITSPNLPHLSMYFSSMLRLEQCPFTHLLYTLLIAFTFIDALRGNLHTFTKWVGLFVRADLSWLQTRHLASSITGFGNRLCGKLCIDICCTACGNVPRFVRSERKQHIIIFFILPLIVFLRVFACMCVSASASVCVCVCCSDSVFQSK